jgi:preprotein translocase subunit SecY
MFKTFANCFKIPELRQRILFTLGLVFICRVLALVPTPGV